MNMLILAILAILLVLTLVWMFWPVIIALGGSYDETAPDTDAERGERDEP